MRTIASLLAAVMSAAVAADPAYVREIEGWRRERVQRLTADGGWLTVAGLFWLKPGANRFGADLEELPVAAFLRTLAAEHRADIVQLGQPRKLIHPVFDIRTDDRRSVLRTQRQ